MNEFCPLCRIDAKEIIWSNQYLQLVLAQDAEMPGFCRVVWKSHVGEMTDLTPQDRSELLSVVWTVEQCVRDVMRPDKVNLASLGNMVPHIHWHIIARYQDDPYFPGSVWSEQVRSWQKDRLQDLLGKQDHLVQTLRMALG